MSSRNRTAMPTNAQVQPLGQAFGQVGRAHAREGFKQEALASWAAYKETGRHLTGQEVRTWLSTWGTDHEGPAPECHK